MAYKWPWTMLSIGNNPGLINAWSNYKKHQQVNPQWKWQLLLLIFLCNLHKIKKCHKITSSQQWSNKSHSPQIFHHMKEIRRNSSIDWHPEAKKMTDKALHKVIRNNKRKKVYKLQLNIIDNIVESIITK